jgi:fatty acid desaturase
MPADITRRDYSLTGGESQRAVEHGLAGADWYRCAIPRKRLKELMQRRDGPAIRDTLIWFAVLGLTGGLAWYFWAAGGACRSSSPMACSTALHRTPVGTSVATAPPSARAG